MDNSTPRVNFAGTTSIPRINEKSGEPFFSCFAPIRGHDKHDSLSFIANSQEEVEEIVAIGVIPLTELVTKEENYEAEDGSTKQELNTNIGAIRSRGEW